MGPCRRHPARPGPLFSAALLCGIFRACALPLRAADREAPAAAGDKLTRFVVISIQRSGTGWLDSTLDFHPCISMANEIFAGDGTEGFWSSAKRQKAIDIFFDEGMKVRSDADAAFVKSIPGRYQDAYNKVKARRGVWVEQENKTGDVRGFDWKINGGVFETWPWFEQYCKKHGVKIIWLQRQQYLRQFVSSAAMKRNNSDHPRSQRRAATMRDDKVTLSVNQMMYFINQWEEQNAHMKYLLFKAKSAGVQTLSLLYEDMLMAPTILDDVAAFVLNGSACAAPQHRKPEKPWFPRIHTGTLKDLIENWSEVRAALVGTAYEHLLGG